MLQYFSDPIFLDIIYLSFRIAFDTMVVSCLIGIPLGMVIAINDFWGKNFIMVMLSTFLAFPSIVVGLIVFMLLANFGPLGKFRLLFTPTAMIIAQTMLVLPFVIFSTIQIIGQFYEKYRILFISLRFGKLQSAPTMIFESRLAFLILTANCFSRALSAIGAVMLVGGNISGYTRILTTDISLQISQGNFALALMMGFILLTIALIINTISLFFQHVFKYQ